MDCVAYCAAICTVELYRCQCLHLRDVGIRCLFLAATAAAAAAAAVMDIHRLHRTNLDIQHQQLHGDRCQSQSLRGQVCPIHSPEATSRVMQLASWVSLVSNGNMRRRRRRRRRPTKACVTRHHDSATPIRGFHNY